MTATDHRRSLSRILNAPRTRLLRVLRGPKPAFEFPHRSVTILELLALVEAAALRAERVDTSCFHPDKSFDYVHMPVVHRALDTIERALPPHRFGDIIGVVARKDDAMSAAAAVV